MKIHDIVKLLEIKNIAELDALFKRAYEIKKQTVGTTVYFRGIIELSNICTKNCFYCGIRKDNIDVTRYLMTKDEALEAARWSYEQGYGSIVIQAGERSDSAFTDFISELLRDIIKQTNGELGITLSLGEQSEAVYREWFKLGAHRYLIRIETSNPLLYQTLHPADHSWQKRIECIRMLKKIGYQTGTGVMIGLPGQTIKHLAEDIQFFVDEDIDMIGMGPFIPHHGTPYHNLINGFDGEQALERALKMIAVCRIVMPDINIASTTALQALNPTGREMGLLAGANIIMPNITDTKYRGNYVLYEGKPCLDENASLCRGCLESRIENIGENIGYRQWGDSLHYVNRQQ